MNDEQKLPAPGSVWQRTNGSLYTVTSIRRATQKAAHDLVTVVYQEEQSGMVWTLLASDWHRSMTLVTAAPAQPAQSGVEALDEFKHWLNDYRMHDVSSVFHEIVAKYRAALNAAPPAAVPKEYDVRFIVLDVVPGPDGMGQEVFAKSNADVVAVMTRMAEQIEELQAASPAPAADAELVAQVITDPHSDGTALVAGIAYPWTFKKGDNLYTRPAAPLSVDKRDAERVDWLEKVAPGQIHFDHTYNRAAGGGNYIEIRVPFPKRFHTTAPSLREAIDAAMRSANGSEVKV